MNPVLEWARQNWAMLTMTIFIAAIVGAFALISYGSLNGPNAQNCVQLAESAYDAGQYDKATFYLTWAELYGSSSCGQFMMEAPS